jgi:hypothetical protein
MSFETFLNLLIKIALTLYPSNDPRKAADQMIEKYFVPVHEMILRETYVGSVIEIIQKPIDFEESRPFLSVHENLRNMYSEAFSDEFHKEGDFSSIEELRSISQKSFFVFNTKFGIIPDYLEKGMAQIVWEEIVLMSLDDIYVQLVASNVYKEFPGRLGGRLRVHIQQIHPLPNYCEPNQSAQNVPLQQ